MKALCHNARAPVCLGELFQYQQAKPKITQSCFSSSRAAALCRCRCGGSTHLPAPRKCPAVIQAPRPRPSAAEMTSQSCRRFVINAPTGGATCESKEAVLTPGGAASEQPLNLPSGSEFFYKVKFSSTHQTSGGVMFRDELPAQLEFVQDSANTPGLQVNGQVITKSYAQLNPGQNETIVFKVRIKENSPIDKITNTAVITTEGVTPVTSQCTEDILGAASASSMYRQRSFPPEI